MKISAEIEGTSFSWQSFRSSTNRIVSWEQKPTSADTPQRDSCIGNSPSLDNRNNDGKYDKGKLKNLSNWHHLGHLWGSAGTVNLCAWAGLTLWQCQTTASIGDEQRTPVGSGTRLLRPTNVKWTRTDRYPSGVTIETRHNSTQLWLQGWYACKWW